MLFCNSFFISFFYIFWNRFVERSNGLIDFFSEFHVNLGKESLEETILCFCIFGVIRKRLNTLVKEYV